MKKLVSVVLVLVMAFSLCAVSASAADVKAGLICMHDENSPYDANFINAFLEACEACGVEAVVKTNIGEDATAYDTACELADDGCSLVFADSYGHQSYILEAAGEFPEVQFVSCTGDLALASDVANYHNAFADIYMGRYLAGVAAGMKLNEMIEAGKFTAEEAKVGYVGAMTYAEVISGYTSWFLGVRSECPSATMEVVFTGSWFDETLEREGAQKLIDNGCKLISQHADSMGAPNACETAGVPNVSYNGSTVAACPNTFIISSRINWVPFYTYAINAVLAGENFDTDWWGTLANGGVEISELNEAVAAAGTAERLAEVNAQLLDGSLKVFDTSTWTVDGETMTQCFAVDTDGDWVADSLEAIHDGAFFESEYRSAPYFNLTIDGIEILGE